MAATVGAVGETAAALPSERVLWQGKLDPYGDVSKAEGLLEALAPFGALAEGFEGKLGVRVGRQAYGALFHLDLPSNWVLAVAGPKRAVLHPYEEGCLAGRLNPLHESYRQSRPDPRASDWLAEHCAANGRSAARVQHVFEEGDLLHIPALGSPSRRRPPGRGWLVSLNASSATTDLGGDGRRSWTSAGWGDPLRPAALAAGSTAPGGH